MLRAIRRQISSLERRLYFALQDFSAQRNRLKQKDDGTLPVRPRHLITGERGEDEAYFYLRALGYTVVARRWRTGRLRGDLDLVAWDGETLIVFEVKTRTARDFAAAEVQVDQEKQRMLRRMANAYIRQFPERHRERVPVRFDVVAVYLLAGAVEVEHFRSAFSRKDDGFSF